MLHAEWDFTSLVTIRSVNHPVVSELMRLTAVFEIFRKIPST